MSASAREEATLPQPSPLDLLNPAQQDQLSRLLEDYLAELESGGAPDVKDLMEQHPELAQALQHSIDGLRFLHQATAAFGPEQGARSQEPPYRELGDFMIKREVGRGGMGIVYEAEQISIGRKVALKVLPFAAVLDHKQIARFNNEAQAAGQLNHPHIVPIYSVGCERGVHYYSMQLIEGQSLDRAIYELRVWHGEVDLEEVAPGLASTASLPQSSEGHRPPPRAESAEARTISNFSTARSIKSRDHIRLVAELGIQAAEGLHHAHQQAIIHRDIKPSNLLIDQASRLWITDFGLARCQAGNNITMTGDVLGTARYMSPEQAAGRAELVDHRTDIYSLGITLYELLTLRQAHIGSDRQELLRRIEQEEPLAPRHLNAAIPQDLETILLKSLAKSRDDRYLSAQDFADDLRRFLAGEPTMAQRPTLSDRALKWASRRRKLVAGVFAATLLTMLGTSLATFLIARAHQRTAEALTKANVNLLAAQENFRDSRRAVDELGAMVTNHLASVPGLEEFRRELLEKTLAHYERFVEKAQGNSELKFDLAFSLSRIGEVRGQLGDFSAALQAYEEAIGVYRDLIAADPHLARFRHDLALCSNNMGQLHEQLGDIESARDCYQSAILGFRVITEQHPDERVYPQGLALSLSNLGSLHRKTGALDAARVTYGEAVSIQEALLPASSDDPELVAQLAASYNELSFLLGATNLQTATEYNSKALSTLERLVTLSPKSWKRRSQLAACYNNRGAIFKRGGQRTEALQAYQRGIEIQEELVHLAPDIVQLQHELGVSYNNLGQLLAEQLPGEAAPQFRRAEAVFAKLVSVAEDSPRYRASLGGVLNNLGLVFERQQRLEDACQEYQRAIRHQEHAFQDAPQVVEFRLLLSTAYANYSRALCDRGMAEAAAEVAQQRKSLWKGDAERLYNVATELARAVGIASSRGESSLAERLTEATVATMLETLQAGFDDHQKLVTDHRFDAVHNDTRWQQLVDDLATSVSGNTGKPMK